MLYLEIHSNGTSEPGFAGRWHMTSTTKSAADRAVFTIATGKPIYLQMACALARSFRLWHADTDIRFYLATDASRDSLPPDLRDIDLIAISAEEYGKGFAAKLHLDKIAPAKRSLFVDADCLCVGSLDEAFESFRGHSVSVIGKEISEGEWFGDVQDRCRLFGLAGVPKFNGGVYYLELGGACSAVFDCARSLLHRYDEIGAIRLRGQANDEILISLAMAIHGEKPIPERGSIMNTLIDGPGPLEIDVVNGHALIWNRQSNLRHNDWIGVEELRPKLVHFLSADANDYPYCREMAKLCLLHRYRLPLWLTNVFVTLAVSAPAVAVMSTKTALRPLFHATFGPRRVRVSARI